jgi:hypothetical protein
MLDGCGGVLNCGSCGGHRGGPTVCIGSGPANCAEERETCTPTTCARLGAKCGQAANGCGGLLDCGTCVTPQACGAGGVFNQCGCAPTTCDHEAANCGTLADGCGGSLSCGTCTGSQTCDGLSHRCTGK